MGFLDGLPKIDGATDPGSWLDGLPTLGEKQGWIFEILIDNTVVYSATASQVQQTLSIDVSAYEGTHNLRFRIRRTI